MGEGGREGGGGREGRKEGGEKKQQITERLNGFFPSFKNGNLKFQKW